MDYGAFARSLYALFSKGDLEAAANMASDDVEVINVGWNVTYSGIPGFLEFMRGWKEMDPNCSVEVIHQLVGPEGVTNECVFHAKHTGTMRSPAGEIPATQQTVTLPFCEVWQIKGGSLKSLHNYADGITIMTQLGVMPASS